MKRSKLKSPKTPSNQTSLLSYFNKSESSSSGTASKSSSASKLPGKSPKQIRRNVNISLGKKRNVDVIDIEDDSPPTTNTQLKRPRIEDSDEEIQVIETPKQHEAPASLTVNNTPKPPLRHRMILYEGNNEFGVGFSSKGKKTPATPRTPTSRKNIGSSVICETDVTPSTTQSLMATSSIHLTCTGVEKEAHELFCVDTEKDHENKVDTTQNKHEIEKSSVGTIVWHHELLDFLQPGYIKDLKGHQPDHPEYNPKTLHIPENYFYQQTTTFKQWWDMKRYYFDTIIFFKVHTNYELFHMDALFGINVLGLPANKGDVCHCTFPEGFYGKNLEILLYRGYKVARVEQSETSESDRIICRISTASTKTHGIYDVTDDKIPLNSVGVSPSYLMALVELTIFGDTTSYGLCFIDTSIGKFILTEFEDNNDRSVLRTVLTHFQPVHVVFRDRVCSDTEAVLNTNISAAKKEALIGKAEFYPPIDVVRKLMEPHFYGNELDKWPRELGNIFNLSVSPPGLLYNRELCVEALGGIMYYLNRCRIDIDMFSMGRLEYYDPPNIFKELQFRVQISGVERWKQKNLALDDITLMNLHLIPPFSAKKVGAGVPNSSSTVSLFITIDFCKTAFGKRLLRSWICAPSCDPTVIAERQDAVEYLIQQNGLIKQMDEYLTNLPDLEIFLQKINTLAAEYCYDYGALITCPDKFNKRKANDFITTLNGFEKISKLSKAYSRLDTEKCPLIEQCIGEKSIDIEEDLLHFEKTFDREKTIAKGYIVPRPGIDNDYDESLKLVVACKAACNDYVDKLKKEQKIPQIKLFGTGKNRYLLEISNMFTEKLGNEFELQSKNKVFNLYSTKELNELVLKLNVAECERNVKLKEAIRKIFKLFSSRKIKFIKMISQIAFLDCLGSLAKYARKWSSLGYPITRPVFDFESDTPFLEIEQGYHPLLISKKAKLTNSASNFIPNDTVFGKVKNGCEEPLITLLTGPNMSGKTTLMTQVALLIVLGQMGGLVKLSTFYHKILYTNISTNDNFLVPAELMKLTPVDRVFSQISAYDSSSAGQSTFEVELDETSSIINNATRDSFVVIDELGRGIPTNDGTAVFGAILNELANNIQCRTFSSTHYITLCELVQNNPKIRLAHMNFIIENKSEPENEDIAVLYKLVNGACMKTCGFFAGKLAGIPNSVLKEAATGVNLLAEQEKKYETNRTKFVATQENLQTFHELSQLCSGKEIDVTAVTNLIDTL